MSTDHPVPGTRTDLMASVRMAARGTPYITTVQIYGFDLAADIADPVWHGLLSRQRVEQVFVHRVTVDDVAGSISISDALYELSWTTGVPQLGAQRRIQPGREVQPEPYRPPDATGGHTFSSDEGRALILDTAAQLGWSVQDPPQQRASMVAVTIGFAMVVLVLVTVAVFAIVAALG